MPDFYQQLIGARRALLILGWALLIAKVALAIEANVKAKLDAPDTLSSRIAAPFALTGTSSRAVDDDTIAAARDVRSRDRRGRPGYVAGQIIVRFRDPVTAARAEEIFESQHVRAVHVLDSFRNLYLVELKAPQTVRDASEQFGALDEVEYAVPNAIYYAD